MVQIIFFRLDLWTAFLWAVGIAALIQVLAGYSGRKPGVNFCRPRGTRGRPLRRRREMVWCRPAAAAWAHRRGRRFWNL